MILSFITIVIYLPQQTLQDFRMDNFSWPNPQFQMKKFIIFTDKGQSQGCLLKENTAESVIYGNDCKNYPSNYDVKKDSLKIKTTNITVIKENDFKKLGHITSLVIGYNVKLYKLEPGCFRSMLNLVNLEIVQNRNLIFLEDKVFEGLLNLTVLSLKRNGFKIISEITKALSPMYLPSLNKLDLSENSFMYLYNNSFSSMNNTKVEELGLSLCGLVIMEELSLIVFKNLKKLYLGQNPFPSKMVVDTIINFNKYNIPLDTLNLYDLGYGKNYPVGLFESIAESNITTLCLSNNQYEKIVMTYFPKMPKIKALDLSDNLIRTIEPNTFNNLPNLEALCLSENKFSKILPAILIPQLKMLDLKLMSGSPGAISYFTIENNIFINMTELEQLSLSYNLIETINKNSFTGLVNLRYLELKNATLFNLESDSFQTTKKLTYLNLENNPLQAMIMYSETFNGLTELKTLLLGGCILSNLSTDPSPFYHLNNLTYLALNNNLLHSLTPNIFKPLISLEFLDLSSNKLVPWNERLFNNLSLKSIDVGDNKFTFLTFAMLEDFKMIENINLEGNPFVCDCNLLPLMPVFINNNILDANCSNLDWQQKTMYEYILHIKQNPHECDNNYSNKILIITISTVFLVLCISLSILFYIYRYYIRYWLFLTKMAIQRHSKWWTKDNKKLSTFIYDAFVSYACSDCHFVNELVTQLEDNEPHLKLCVYERDFKIGSVISEEVLQSVLKSKRTLLVISDGFARSQWCQWEMKLAEYHRIFFQNDDSSILDDTLIMIKLNEVQKKYITPTLKYLMKTRIYLQWDSENELEFWKKLRRTLAAPKCGQNKKSMETSL